MKDRKSIKRRGYMKYIKVSIVIPTFNRKELLKENLKSLFNQTYPKDKYEIIVCDDGSTDGTEEVVKELIKKSPGVLRYYKQKNKGPASVRNLGIYNAKGEIIGFIDDDCIASPTWIEQAIHYFENQKIGGIQGCVAAQAYKENKSEKIFKIAYAVTHTEDTGLYVVGNMFYRKKVIVEAGCFDPEVVWGEDTDLAYRVKRWEYEILFCENVIVYHAVKYIGYFEFFKRLKNYEFFALQLKRNPEIRKTLYLGFILRKQDIYPIFTILTIILAISNINRYFIYTTLLISIVSYLRSRVFKDFHAKLYPIRIMAFIRNLVIDSLALYHVLRGAIRYKCFVI